MVGLGPQAHRRCQTPKHPPIHKNPRMKPISKFFLVLTILSAVVWLIGMISAVTIPLFGGIRAEEAGGICLVVSVVAEMCAYLFGWIFHKIRKERNDSHSST